MVCNAEEPVMLVPHKFITGVAIILHNEYAHVGRDKLIYLIRKVFWHPSLYNVCNDVCVSCQKCQITKEYSTVVSPPTLRIQSCYPFELVAIDLVSFPKTAGGYIGCLMAVDHFSKWVASVRIRDKRSSTVVNALKFQVLPSLPRVPANILSDNGPEFTSSEFSDLMSSFSVKHKLTTPYQPSSNGCVERVNQSIKNLIRSLTESGLCWDQNLPKAVITYNNTVHSDLKMTPAEFLITKAHVSEVDRVPNDITEMWKEGHPNFCSFKVGQLVLVKINLKGFLNTNKFSDNYDGPCEVTQVNSNGVTYQVKNVATGSVSRVHHTKLRPLKSPPQYIQNHPYFSKYYSESSFNTPTQQSQLQPPERLPVTPAVPYLRTHYGCDTESSDSSSSGDSPVSSSEVIRVLQREPDARSPSRNNTECCRGCKFETRKELEVSLSCHAPSLVLDGLGCFGSDDGPVVPLTANGRNWADWTDSDSESFVLPSIDSQGMVDESADDMGDEYETDNEASQELSDADKTENSLPVDDASLNKKAVGSPQSGYEFTGFEPNDGTASKRDNLHKLIKNNENSTSEPVPSSSGMALRSRGAVQDLPYVQCHILERKRHVYLKGNVN